MKSKHVLEFECMNQSTIYVNSYEPSLQVLALRRDVSLMGDMPLAIITLGEEELFFLEGIPIW